MSRRIWAPDDPRHPSSVDGKDLPPSRHVGVVLSTPLVGPQVLYQGQFREFAPSRRMEAGIDTYAPGGQSPTHSHALWEKVFVVLEGTARIDVGDESRVVGPGSVAFVPVNMPHGFSNPGDTNLRMFSVTARFEDPDPPEAR